MFVDHLAHRLVVAEVGQAGRAALDDEQLLHLGGAADPAGHQPVDGVLRRRDEDLGDRVDSHDRQVEPASVRAIDRPPLECSRLWNCSRRHSARVRSSACTARRVCALIVSGLGKQQALPSGVDDRHVVGEEVPAVLAQQAQHGRRLAGVGERGEHHADAVEADRRRVQQHVAAGDHDEAQQRLDDVGVDDVRGTGQQRPDGDGDRVGRAPSGSWRRAGPGAPRSAG